MIKWIHQNKRSVVVFLVGGAVALSMSFFRVDMGRSKSKRYAIKIGDEQITADEFRNEKKTRQENLAAQYKQMLGENFKQFAKQIYNMPNQQIVDTIISERLFAKEASRVNLFVGEE